MNNILSDVNPTEILDEALAVECYGIGDAVLVVDIDNPGRLKVSDAAKNAVTLSGVLSGHNMDKCPIENGSIEKTPANFAEACGNCALADVEF